jgi:hypothetical protein
MTTVTISSVVGLIPPFSGTVCDVYGNNCYYVGSGSTFPITFTLPTIFNTAPTIQFTLIDSVGCERIETLLCDISDLEYTISYSCGYDPDTITINSSTISGGTPPYSAGTTYFTSQSAALANTSWNGPLTSFGYGVTPINTTYWVVIIDSVGNITTRSIITDCEF